MDPLGFLKAIWTADEPIQTDIFRLRPGQIISGKIIKFFPNQMAEVQIGTHRLMAKLEASLSVNQQYWFQVLSGEGKIRLKLMKEKPGETLPTDPKEDIAVGSQSLNSRLDGQIEHFITQVPLKLGADSSDLTIQWNGRKKENGKIDPDDCRIFFFLELKNIGELFVDLQIQNRKLSISITNGMIDQNMIAEPQFIILKEHLQKLNYQLASIKFERPANEKPFNLLFRKAMPLVVKNENFKGVDIRI